MDAPIPFVEDVALAEAMNGSEREVCMSLLQPECLGRWGSDEMGRRALAKAAWESGWDHALLKARRLRAPEEHAHAGALERLIAQRDAEHETARAWQDRYADQLCDMQRLKAQVRDLTERAEALRAERDLARADAVLLFDCYGGRLFVPGRVVERLGTYRGAGEVAAKRGTGSGVIAENGDGEEPAAARTQVREGHPESD